MQDQNHQPISLKQFHLLYSVSGAKKEALAVGCGNRLKRRFRRLEELFVGAGSVAAEDLFDFAPHRRCG